LGKEKEQGDQKSSTVANNRRKLNLQKKKREKEYREIRGVQKELAVESLTCGHNRK